MNKNPVFVVDDDTDDHDFVRESWKELNYVNTLHFFSNGKDLLTYMKANKITPFLILCDVNIAPTDGFELKKKLLEDESLHYKSVPFIFWSTGASNEQIKKAFNLSAHGFFVKGRTLTEIKESLSYIVTYWQNSMQPEID